MTDPTTARSTLAGFVRSTLGEPAVPAMSYPIMVDGTQVGWSASCYETARSLAVELTAEMQALSEARRDRDGWRDDAKLLMVERDVAREEASSLRHQLQMSASKIERVEAERDAALARVTELEAPGECNSIHKLRAQVTDLQAAVERVRPVVEVLAGACHSAVRGEVATISRLVIGLGRGNSTFYDTAAWLRSLLSTAPDPVHRPGHTDLMVAPESVLDLAPTECPACRGSGWGDAREIATCVVCRGSGLAPQSEPLAEHEPDESKGTRWESPPQSAPAPDGRFTVDSAWRFKRAAARVARVPDGSAAGSGRGGPPSTARRMHPWRRGWRPSIAGAAPWARWLVPVQP